MNTERKLKMKAQKRSARKQRKLERKKNSYVRVDFMRLNTGNSYGPCGQRWYTEGFYADQPFFCKDCGRMEIWTAEQQRWWYEEMGGLVETTAVRCRACRIRERERKAEARRVSEEGRSRKQARMALHIALPSQELSRR
jgi:hypothetical protein